MGLPGGGRGGGVSWWCGYWGGRGRVGWVGVCGGEEGRGSRAPESPVQVYVFAAPFVTARSPSVAVWSRVESPPLRSLQALQWLGEKNGRGQRVVRVGGRTRGCERRRRVWRSVLFGRGGVCRGRLSWVPVGMGMGAGSVRAGGLGTERRVRVMVREGGENTERQGTYRSHRK